MAWAQGSGADAVRFHSYKAGCYSYDCIRSNKIIRDNLSECQLSDGKEQDLKLMGEQVHRQRPKRAYQDQIVQNDWSPVHKEKGVKDKRCQPTKGFVDREKFVFDGKTVESL